MAAIPDRARAMVDRAMADIRRPPPPIAAPRGPGRFALTPLLFCACASLAATNSAADRSPNSASLTGARQSPSDTLAYKDALSGLKWRNIGPFRGGRSVAVAGVPGRDRTYYMGTTGGGVWKTENAGSSWENISDGKISTGSIGAIAVAPSAPEVIYVGTGEHAVRGVMSSAGDGMYRSDDGGETWRHLGLPQSRHISDVIVHPRDPELVYVAVQGAAHGPSRERGVYRSSDGGKNWKRLLYVDENTGASGLTMDPNNPSVLYAATWEHRRHPWKVVSGGPGSGIHKSVDGGDTWTKLGDGLPKMMGKIGLSASAARTGRVFANIEAGDDKGGVYRSDDAGKTWKQTTSARKTQTRSWYYMEIFADPRDADTVYVLNAQMLRSVDGGKTFKKISTPHGDQHDLWINPHDPQTMINGNDGGACITYDGGRTWSTQANQPTAQFYRVAVDEQFPYHVYGGQQDNSAIAIASRTAGASIGVKDWYSVAGCETAYLAFDRKSPRHIFGGCYQGGISAYDARTRQQHSIAAYPENRFGIAPADMKFRFNWNAPLIASQHDPSVIYHAAEVVLRSEDRGQSWQIASPDLTRNDRNRQGEGGGPITNETAGGENYNTIMYLAESPHKRGELWAGSDDGRIHVSLDDTRTWRDVTPKGLAEGIINAIEVSPHDPSTVYFAFTRYKFDDLRPVVYRSKNSGRSWQNLSTRGIHPEAFVRVVREDPQRPGLLYAGTERGLYISFDAGRRWHQFSTNLPNDVPITDLVIHDNDLVVATSGRSFWILDDLGALQQSGGEFPKRGFALYTPKPTVLFGRYLDPKKPARHGGQNLSGGVAIDYHLARSLDDDKEGPELTLEIHDAQGQLVRRYSHHKPKDFEKFEGGPKASPQLPSKAGMNRFVWDFRRETLPAVPGLFTMGDYSGPRVAPGDYRITLKLADARQHTQVRVTADPRLDATPEDYKAQQDALLAVSDLFRDLVEQVARARAVHAQLEAHQKLLRDDASMAQLRTQASELAEKFSAWEATVVQTKQKTWQDVINFPNRLNAQILFLKDEFDSHQPKPRVGALQRLRDLQASWAKSKAELTGLFSSELAAYDRAYKAVSAPAIIVPQSPTTVSPGPSTSISAAAYH